MVFPPADFWRRTFFFPRRIPRFQHFLFSLALFDGPMQKKPQTEKSAKNKRGLTTPAFLFYFYCASTIVVSSDPYNAFSSAAVTSFLKFWQDWVAPAIVSICSGRYFASINA